MAAIGEWRGHDGVRYLYLAPGGFGTEHLDDVLRVAHDLMTAEPPGLLRVLFDNRVNAATDAVSSPSKAGFLPGGRQLGEAKRVQREVLREHTLRIAGLGVPGVGGAILRGMSAMSARVTIVPTATMESAVEFVTRPVH